MTIRTVQNFSRAVEVKLEDSISEREFCERGRFDVYAALDPLVGRVMFAIRASVRAKCSRKTFVLKQTKEQRIGRRAMMLSRRRRRVLESEEE